MTPEQIDARIDAMAADWGDDVRRLVLEIMAPPTGPPVDPPPVEPPPVGTGWWKPPPPTYWRPVGTGQERPAHAANLTATLQLAGPGDVVTLAPGIYPKTEWTTAVGSRPGGPGAPITLQAKPGETVEFEGLSLTDNSHALRIEGIEHWRLANIGIGKSQFPLRAWASNGHVTHCDVHDAGHAGFSVQKSIHHLLVEANEVHHTGRALTGTQPYGEGIYIGNGSKSWVDTCHDIELRWNDIHHTIGDAMDLKAGVWEIWAHHNRLHDLDVRDGSVVSHTNARVGDDDPAPQVLKRIRLDHNLIWNIGWGGQANSAYGFTFHLGGEVIEDNLLWGFNPAFGVNTRGVNIRGTSTSSKFPMIVRRNTIWVAQSIVKYYNAGLIEPPLQMSDNITPDGLLATTKKTTSDFLRAPAANVRGEAMATSGPYTEGTGFRPHMRVDA